MKQKLSQRLSRTSKIYFSVFAVFLAICVLIAAFCLQYYRRLHSTIRDESKGYLQEVARRVGDNIDRIIADNYGVLYTMAAPLELRGELTLDEARTLLQRQQEFWSFESLMMMDEDGVIFDLSGTELFLTVDASVRQDLLRGRRTMSTAQIINNKEYVIFSVPVQGTMIDGRRIVALAGSYAPASFDQALSMKSFNDQAYSQIISKSGAVIIRSSSPLASKTGYNIYSTLQNAKLDKDSSTEQLREDIRTNRGGQIGFTLGGEHQYMVYTSINPDDWYLLTFVPVQVVNAQSDMLLRSTLLISGLLVLAFASLCATLAFVFNSHRHKLEQLAYVDPVTGGNTIQRFYELATNALTAAPQQRFALVYTNIAKFKVLNEQIGRQNCDLILQHFHNFISQCLLPLESIGRHSADNFCILLTFDNEQEFAARCERWHTGATEFVTTGQMPWALPATEFGVYVIENRALPFPQMIDRAKLALKEVSWTVDSHLRYAFYDDTLRRQLIRDKELEDRMEKSLQDSEFLVYLQPKYHLPDETVGGAEALVRWKTADEGMIYPDEFIPLFEKNGFIIKIDLFVFEQVCRLQCEWKARGFTPIKVSVNCSRVHFKNPAFLAPYIRIAEQYDVDRSLLEIELTESIVLENSDRLVHIIDDIKRAGFGCSMDDFGSGYSSLNMIQSIPVDTLKLDKIFFQSSSVDASRTEAVVCSIVSMAKNLSMETVAEGVEYRDQVEMLKRAGCDYIQGYIFAKPMPVSSFEDRAFGTQA